MKKLILVSVAAVFLLGGCVPGVEKIVEFFWVASKQPYGSWAAYWDNKYSEDVYQIMFVGRSGVKISVLEDFSLYRAAKFTIGAGKEFFLIECADIYGNKKKYAEPPYRLTTKIRILPQNQPGSEVLRATEVIETIGRKYELPPHGRGWRGPE